MRETWVRSLGREDPREKEMATHSSILDWRISWMEEPGGLQSMGSQRVRQDWASSLSLITLPQQLLLCAFVSYKAGIKFRLSGLWNLPCTEPRNAARPIEHLSTKAVFLGPSLPCTRHSIFSVKKKGLLWFPLWDYSQRYFTLHSWILLHKSKNGTLISSYQRFCELIFLLAIHVYGKSRSVH